MFKSHNDQNMGWLDENQQEKQKGISLVYDLN